MTKPLNVERVQRLRDIDAPQWDQFSEGLPFRRYAWSDHWWRCYDEGCELYVLRVQNAAGEVLGIAPWYRQSTARQGRVLRFLGSGEVCTDYLTLLCRPHDRQLVAASVAAWLTDAAQAPQTDNRWELLELENVPARDPAIQALTEALRIQGNSLAARPADSCWSVELPASWQQYLALLSKSHRKQLRRLDRRFLNAPRFRFQTAQSRDELRRGMKALVDLHQHRWTAAGQRGCFASEPFSRFLHAAAGELFCGGRLALNWLEDEGRAVAAQIDFVDEAGIFVYQGGIDPTISDYAPGHLLTLRTVQQAIESGVGRFDFLRGDEPYKSHWRAKPSACLDWRIAPRRISAQLRNGAWLAGDAVKQAVKTSLRWTGLRQRP